MKSTSLRNLLFTTSSVTQCYFAFATDANGNIAGSSTENFCNQSLSLLDSEGRRKCRKVDFEETSATKSLEETTQTETKEAIITAKEKSPPVHDVTPPSYKPHPTMKHHVILGEYNRVRVSKLMITEEDLKANVDNIYDNGKLEFTHEYPTVRWQSEPDERSINNVLLKYQISPFGNWHTLPYDVSDDDGAKDNMHDFRKGIDIQAIGRKLTDIMTSTSGTSTESANMNQGMVDLVDKKAFFWPKESKVHFDLSKSNLVIPKPNFFLPQDLSSDSDSDNINDQNLPKTKTPLTFRQYVFEFLTPPKYNASQIHTRLHTCKIPGCKREVGTDLILDNEYCRIHDFHLEAGEGGTPDTVHHHTLDNVFVNPDTGSRLIGYKPELLNLGENSSSSELFSNSSNPLTYEERKEKLNNLVLFNDLSTEDRVVYREIPEDAYLTENHNKFSHGGIEGDGDKSMRELLVEIK